MDERWDKLIQEMDACQKCGLCRTRMNVVKGAGNIEADIMFIGEGPGAEEDYQGVPFVGAAGQLLDRMMATIRLDRRNSYIANIVKCRPPHNRTPLPEEAAACLPFLREQVRLVHPKIIVALGATAGRYTISPQLRITRDRGVWVERKGFYLIATFHPSYLLREPAAKREAWADFKAIRDKIKQLGIQLEREEEQ